MLTGKRVLITGGGGFIGTALAEALAENNEILLFDSNFDTNAFAFAGMGNHPNVRTMRADILDEDAVKSALSGMQYVFHLAARLGVAEVVSNASYTLDVNYIGSSGLLKAVSASPDLERLLFFSTSEVFGSSAFRVSENSKSTLSSVQDARWCYSLCKLAAEHLAFAYSREKGLPVTVVRPFNVFGPRRVGDNATRRFIVAALKGRPLTVHGDGTQIRAWCHIDDFCDGVLRASSCDDALGEAFNIGNPLNTVSVYRLARSVVELSKSESQIVFEESGIAEVDVRVPDIAKARRLLDFSPSVDLDDGLTRTIDWYSRHLDKFD